MNRKFIISTIIIAEIVSNSFAADITYYGLADGQAKIDSINFYDVLNQGADYWAKSAIYQAGCMGIMSGFSANKFSPTTTVTNEQAITTVINAMGKAKEVENIKMIATNWSDKYIKYAMNNGLLTEKIVYKKEDVKSDIDALKDRGVFIRDIPITREEVATLVCKAFSISPKAEDDRKPIEFLDSSLISEKRVADVDAVSMAGIMVGDESKMFNPKSNLTRAEFAQILKNSEEYLIKNLHLTKLRGFIDSVNGNGFEITDDDGNEIKVNCVNRDVPIIRNNTLGGVASLKSSDEIEFFVDTSRQVVFAKVLDEGIYGDDSTSNNLEARSKQGIVTGNSPYFYEISVKDKNGVVDSYKYGTWTEIYKDGKQTSASDILQGDTVYLEFDELGDLISIRGVTNATINYGTVVSKSKSSVTFRMDLDNSLKEYNLRKIPVYENGVEIDLEELYNGKYAKIYSSQSELIKVEIVADERTAENLYKGYISEINLIQDRIVLRSPKIFKDGKWESAKTAFITIPLDNDMKLTYDGEVIKKTELGEKQVGKFAYIATREDTTLLEKAKAITIEFENDKDTIVSEIRSYTESSGLLKLYDDTRKIYTDESTIYVCQGKIVNNAILEKGDNISVTVAYEDDEYVAKIITSVEREDEKIVEIYTGTITDIEEGEEISIKLEGRFEDQEWETMRNKSTSFTIESDTRIFSETEPLTFKEFDNTYKGEKVCIVAYGDEAVLIGIADLGETPYITIGSVKNSSDTAITIIDAEYYDYEEEEWIEDTEDEEIAIDVSTLITRNGSFARSSEIKNGQEAIVIRSTKESKANVILLTD